MIDDAMLTRCYFLTQLTVTIDVKPNSSGLERTAAIVSNKNDLITIEQDA
jgi:hypothetical protein